MIKLKIFIIFLLGAILAESKENNLKKIYASLNEREKLYFSEYFLIKGVYEERKSPLGFLMNRNLAFPPEIVQKFETLNVPKEFPVQFVNRVMDTYHLSRPEVMKLARGEEVCLPIIGCIDPGDAGNICCT